MAGYSGTPLPKKLGLVGAACALVVGAPAGFLASLGDLPDSLELRERPKKAEQYDVIVWFVKRRADFERKLDDVRQRLTPSGGLWIAWPKRSSGVVTDMTEQVIREVALPTGLVDNKVCAIDETWSGLRLVVRRALR